MSRRRQSFLGYLRPHLEPLLRRLPTDLLERYSFLLSRLPLPRDPFPHITPR